MNFSNENIQEVRIGDPTQFPFICDKLISEGVQIILVVGQVKKRIYPAVSAILIEMSVRYRVPIIQGLYTSDPTYQKYEEEVNWITQIIR